MAPVTQTLFSITLFLALSSLIRWLHRGDRDVQRVGASAAVAPARAESVK